MVMIYFGLMKSSMGLNWLPCFWRFGYWDLDANRA